MNCESDYCVPHYWSTYNKPEEHGKEVWRNVYPRKRLIHYDDCQHTHWTKFNILMYWSVSRVIRLVTGFNFLKLMLKGEKKKIKNLRTFFFSPYLQQFFSSSSPGQSMSPSQNWLESKQYTTELLAIFGQAFFPGSQAERKNWNDIN